MKEITKKTTKTFDSEGKLIRHEEVTIEKTIINDAPYSYPPFNPSFGSPQFTCETVN